MACFVRRRPVLLIVILSRHAWLSIGGAALSSRGSIRRHLLAIGRRRIIIGALSLALGIWALIWLGCLRGTVGPNQYGPDPLEGRSERVRVDVAYRPAPVLAGHDRTVDPIALARDLAALPLGDAGRGRRAGAARNRAGRRRLRGPPPHLLRARHRAGRKPLRPHRHRRAASRVRRPYRRGAARRRGRLVASRRSPARSSATRSTAAAPST